MSNDLFLKICVSSDSLSLSLSVTCDLFVFVLFCGAFCKAVFDSNFGFSGFVFLSLSGFLLLLSGFVGFVLRPFNTCSFLLFFFYVILPFFTFVVTSFSSGCFFFPVLFSLGRRRALFFCVRLFRFLVCFVFPGPYSTQLFPLLVLFSAICRVWIHSLFSFFQLGLVLWPSSV